MSSTQENPSGPPQAPPPPPIAPQAPPPQYAAPPGASYPQRPAPPEPWKAKNWMGITSLVLSLMGLVTGISAIAGIVFGHLSLSAVKHGEADNRSVGLAGLIVGYVLTGLAIVALIFFLIFLFSFVPWIIEECAGDNPADWCTSTG